MKWLENFTLVMRSSLTSLREKVEDPERLLHQLVVDMEEELEAVKASVAEAIVDEIQLGKEALAARKDARLWEERAAEAVRRGDETAARSALTQKVASESRAASLEAEHARQKADTARLQGGLRDLEEKIRQAKQKRTLLLARLAKAESSRKIQGAFESASRGSAFAHFQRLETRVERAEAKEEAYARLDGRDPDAEELRRKFEAEERRQKVESELADLKKRVTEEGAGPR